MLALITHIWSTLLDAQVVVLSDATASKSDAVQESNLEGMEASH
jgi:hypothetical protein